MTRVRFAIYAAAVIAFGAAATQASALRNNYTNEPVPGILPWIFGEAGYYDPGYAYERPIRRPYRPAAPYGYDRSVPPPPFLEDGEY